MIAWLKGLILEKNISQLILDVNGVGYDIAISNTTFLSLPNEGQSYACFIQTIVREDTLALYGFSERSERSLFQDLIKVSGIGPKVALGILSSVSASEFIGIIQQKKISALVKLPGIGKKTAERLLIELADNFAKLAEALPVENKSMTLARQEAAQALISLGYPTKQAEKVVFSLDDGAKSVDELIRLSLKELSTMS